MSFWKYLLWWGLASSAACCVFCWGMGRWMKHWDREVEKDFRRKSAEDDDT